MLPAVAGAEWGAQTRDPLDLGGQQQSGMSFLEVCFGGFWRCCFWNPPFLSIFGRVGRMEFGRQDWNTPCCCILLHGTWITGSNRWVWTSHLRCAKLIIEKITEKCEWATPDSKVLLKKGQGELAVASQLWFKLKFGVNVCWSTKHMECSNTLPLL